jgi:putative FmdB family regulatory protein
VPTYQYACTDCGERSEVVQRFTDDPLTVCSACGGKLRKVFSPVGIVFKGSGFYRTDSRKGASTVPAGKDSPTGGSDGSASGSSSGSSDKPASGDSSSSSGSDSGSSKPASSGSSGSAAASGASGGGKKSESVAAPTGG